MRIAFKRDGDEVERDIVILQLDLLDSQSIKANQGLQHIDETGVAVQPINNKLNSDSYMCAGFPLSYASPKILTMCHKYHKAAKAAHDKGRETCKSNHSYWTETLSHHYDNSMKYRHDRTCKLADGPTTHYCACVEQDRACHVEIDYKAGEISGVNWRCETAE